MDTPWKVVGFEFFKSERGDDCVRLHLARPMVVPEGSTGEGLEARMEFYKPMYMKEPYTPVIGHMVFVLKNRYGVERVLVVGVDNGK